LSINPNSKEVRIKYDVMVHSELIQYDHQFQIEKLPIFLARWD
jgi:hypothetical protein